MNWTVQPAKRLEAEIVVPGDKSISHRALMFAAIAATDSAVEGLADGEDVAATMAALGALGVDIESSAGQVRVAGVGLHGLRRPEGPVDCGNSGTTMRLLAGLLAGQPFETTLVGDPSLSGRPMKRVADPLSAMGARVATSARGTAPLTVHGSRPLRAITLRPEIASAQVKSCVLLAGLNADGPTTIVEPGRSRDHTERMLAAMGADLRVVAEGQGSRATIHPQPVLRGLHGRIPGDTSSAAYWMVAAALCPGSAVTLPGVGFNPTRAAIVDLLVSWGAAIEVDRGEDWFGEPVGRVTVTATGERLTGGVVEPPLIAGLIDELPLIAALAPLTRDGVEIRGASELRVKESDRIDTVVAALRALGVDVEEFPDGMAIGGGQQLHGGTIAAGGDHRIALAFGAVAVAAEGSVTVQGAEVMAVSYPGFATELDAAACR